MKRRRNSIICPNQGGGGGVKWTKCIYLSQKEYLIRPSEGGGEILLSKKKRREAETCDGGKKS